MDILLTEHPHENIVVVTLAGHLDVDNAAELQTTLDDLLRRRITRIVVDLSGLEFCDSMGLSALIIGHTACAAQGGWLRLAAPNPFLVRVLDVVGLLGRLPVYRSLPAALSADERGLITAAAERL
jgi:anti-sigma B factor antagonist